MDDDVKDVQTNYVFHKGAIVILKSTGHPLPLPLFSDDKGKQKALP